MRKTQQSSSCLFLFLFATFFHHSFGDVGTAAQFGPPYLPTACFGNDASAFPPNNLFAAAGEGIWDNGASCGREYYVSCISAAVRGTCKPDQTIRVKIVDRAQTSVTRPSRPGATIVLSEVGFGKIANPAAPYVNVEYQQV
ncbi:EG45-like domain containing protein isoform X1 [Ricinus communis]|uniref:EG45-like domain containing protein isoform X1 n=1 Tax=Ricinus communis TaxID=3988 RepID=UPI00201A639D|nr:EG45-like domain containing protein isoform X1 [Ricinus communis]